MAGAARLLSKSRSLEISSVRYINQQVEKVICGEASVDRTAILHFVGCAALGGYPGASVTAPLQMRINFYSDPVSTAKRFLKASGSAALFSCLAEYLYYASRVIPLLNKMTYPSVYEQVTTVDEFVRKPFYLGLHRQRTRRRKTDVEVVVRPTVDRTLFQLNVKRKVSSAVVEKVGIPRLRSVYRHILSRAPSVSRIDPDVLSEVESMVDNDSTLAQYLYMHAVVQRSVFQIIPMDASVARRLKARIGSHMVHVCRNCYTIRTRAKDTRLNKKMGGVIFMGDGSREKPGRWACAACSSTDLCSVDATGVFIRSLAKNADKEPYMMTVCSRCTVFSANVSFCGVQPICSGCAKLREKTVRCCLCSKYISLLLFTWCTAIARSHSGVCAGTSQRHSHHFKPFFAGGTTQWKTLSVPLVTQPASRTRSARNQPSPHNLY